MPKTAALFKIRAPEDRICPRGLFKRGYGIWDMGDRELREDQPQLQHAGLGAPILSGRMKMTLLRSKPALRWSYGGLKGGKS
ncbi:MAG: hypothetical protein EBT07_14335 [Actinobacteria bacterium]|nr:hypothetical protein [Actinomycetota bacterium]